MELNVEEVEKYPWKLFPKVGVNKHNGSVNIVYPKSPSCNTDKWDIYDSIEEANKAIQDNNKNKAIWFANSLIALISGQKAILEKTGESFDYDTIERWIQENRPKL